MPQDDTAELGLRIRKEMFGVEAVERAMRGLDPLVAPLHELINRYAFGAIWGRDGLPRRIRSLITLAMMCALDRPRELRVHLRAALVNGCSREEIAEVLLQSAVCCGVPAALDAFDAARDILHEPAPLHPPALAENRDRPAPE